MLTYPNLDPKPNPPSQLYLLATTIIQVSKTLTGILFEIEFGIYYRFLGKITFNSTTISFLILKLY